MLRTYKAILDGDRVQWTGEAPGSQTPIDVHITLLDEQALPVTAERGRGMADALQALADRGGISGISDPAAWQRQVRRDRPLPGRPE